METFFAAFVVNYENKPKTPIFLLWKTKGIPSLCCICESIPFNRFLSICNIIRPHALLHNFEAVILFLARIEYMYRTQTNGWRNKCRFKMGDGYLSIDVANVLPKRKFPSVSFFTDSLIQSCFRQDQEWFSLDKLTKKKVTRLWS